MTTPPATYEIRLAGHLDDHWGAWLGDLDLTRDHDDGTTTVVLTAADQAQLHGVLVGLRDIGATLVGLRTTGAPAPPARPVLDDLLCTQRLTLRAATVGDADPTWSYRRLDVVNEWLTDRPGDLDAYRELFVEPGRLASTVVVTLGHGAAAPVIGDLMLRREDAWAQSEVADRGRAAQAELGWALDPAHTGRGYATEAVRELLRACFVDLGVRRATATCFLANTASWRLMERVGMRRELHAVGESLHRSGRWLDTVGYALLAEEWPPG